MGLPKPPPAVAQEKGRSPGTDSGGRPINYGPEIGIPDQLDKPDDMSAAASRLWDVLILEMKGSGVLRSVDATALSMLCETYARWSEASSLRKQHGVVVTNRHGDRVRAPWVTTEAEASKALQSWLREFGLTPSAVTSLLAKQPAVDPLDDPFEWQDTP